MKVPFDRKGEIFNEGGFDSPEGKVELAGTRKARLFERKNPQTRPLETKNHSSLLEKIGRCLGRTALRERFEEETEDRGGGKSEKEFP